MSPTHVPRESRRSTRIQLKVVIEANGVTEPLVCDGETFVVNLHGALIATAVPLLVGMKIQIHVIPTNIRGAADVVYVDPERPRVCGMGLVMGEHLGLFSLPPSDWHEGGHETLTFDSAFERRRF